jgi:hypothetical protein
LLLSKNSYFLEGKNGRTYDVRIVITGGH